MMHISVSTRLPTEGNMVTGFNPLIAHTILVIIAIIYLSQLLLGYIAFLVVIFQTKMQIIAVISQHKW